MIFANSERKRAIIPLKVRSEPVDEWVPNTDIGSHTYDYFDKKKCFLKFLRKIKRSDVLTAANEVIRKGIVVKTFLETMFFFFLEIIQALVFRLLEYAEGVAKASIGLMNAD